MLLQTLNYFDLHCDALTGTGESQVKRQALATGGCLLQCFAAFISVREGRYEEFLRLADKFNELCRAEGYRPVRKYGDIGADKINALFTVEDGGALEGDISKLDILYERGVRMLGLTWNYPNEIGFPNFPDYEGLIAGRASFSAREERGLTPFGFEVVSRMRETGMIVDLAHASDGVFQDVAGESRRTGVPFCVSHTASASVLDCARNLIDTQIKTLADCGGVAGLYFCADFLSPDGSADGQRAAILKHARAMINAGGENVLTLGSDFDGIPPNAYLPDASYLPRLYEDFSKEFGSSVAQKIFRTNALEFLKIML